MYVSRASNHYSLLGLESHLLSVYNPISAVLIDVRDIARFDPAIRSYCLSCGIGLLPVALHRVETATP